MLSFTWWTAEAWCGNSSHVHIQLDTIVVKLDLDLGALNRGN